MIMKSLKHNVVGIGLMILTASFISCTAQVEEPKEIPGNTGYELRSDYTEKYRPQYHYSSDQRGVGDPVGLYYKDGIYHMYWWGETLSSDLVYYAQQSPSNVLKGGYGAKFSGSTIVDFNNSAGFGENTVITFCTLFTPEKETQAMFVSNDGGHSFEYVKTVIDENRPNQRDPDVFWYEEGQHWVMLTTNCPEEEVLIYTSKDLHEWAKQSVMYHDGPGNWSECPNLFKARCGEEYKWMMLLSVGDDGMQQYAVGDFDGKTFVPTQPWKMVDKGADFYAMRMFRDFSGEMEDAVAVSWVSTWLYSRKLPATWRGKGFWSIPRIMGLEKVEDGYDLVQQPWPGLEKLRGEVVRGRGRMKAGYTIPEGFVPENNVYEVELNFKFDRNDAPFGLDLCVGEGRRLPVRFDPSTDTFTVDRTNCADVEIEKFPMTKSEVIATDGENLHMRIFVDQSSVEIFLEEGHHSFSFLTYPSENQCGLEFYSEGKGPRCSYRIWPLESIWKKID